MNLPNQCEPVQRTTASQPWANHGNPAAQGNGVVPSQYGVDASGWEDILGSIAKVALPALTSLI